MAHLGSDVAAYVDGQLTAAQMAAAERHLRNCDDCRHAARQQEVLKGRIRETHTPGPPPQLVLNLAGLKDRDLPDERRWARIRHSLPARVAVAVLSTAAVVLATAYAVGSPAPDHKDAVTPAVDDYVVAFSDLGSAPVRSAIQSVSYTSMRQLEGSGWPCHEWLGPRFQRTDAALIDHDDAFVVSYSDGDHRLKLFEQNGSLDTSQLDGFEPRSISDQMVWVRPGQLTVVTWDADGIVYTIVTDADIGQLEPVLRDLPAHPPARDPLERIGGGLTKMASWLGVA